MVEHLVLAHRGDGPLEFRDRRFRRGRDLDRLQTRPDVRRAGLAGRKRSKAASVGEVPQRDYVALQGVRVDRVLRALVELTPRVHGPVIIQPGEVVGMPHWSPALASL